MDDDQQFCLRWNNHQSTLISVFDTLLENGTLVDCTLAAEGKVLKAHKVVLSACSPYFATLLAQQYDKHPIFILKDVKFQELRAMMDYMYRGEVNISQDQLAALLKAAESLQIKGLSDNRAASSVPQPPPPQQQQPPAKKQGLTIEHKRAQAQAAAAAAAKLAAESDVSMSREGSSSPSGRKRKKVRRRTVEQATAAASDASGADVAATNAAATTSSNAQSTALASNAAAAAVSAATAAAAAAAANNAAATASSSALASSSANASAVSVTKKTDMSDAKKELDQSQRAAAANDHDDDDDDDDEDDDDQHDMEPRTQRMKHQHQQQDGAAGNDELLIEPKSEYDNDETVEDLTMDDEELLEDLEQAGPSHGGEGSSHGYAQWQVDRQDEVFMGGQESAGQHRDAQVFAECFYGAPANTLNGTPIVMDRSTSTSMMEHHTGSSQTGSPRQRQRLRRRAVSRLPNVHVNEVGAMVFSCPRCSKVLGRDCSRHLRECGASPRHQCPFCHHCSKRSDNLRTHIRRMHQADM